MTRAPRPIAFLLITLLALPLSLTAGSKEDSSKVDPKKDRDDVEKIGDRKIGGGMNFYSLEKEISLGKQMATEIERSSRIIDDPVIAEYINRIGQNIVRNSDAKVPFTIKMIDSDQVNAFALPGGFFFVHSGLMLRADSEAELAGVMAHEIAHVAARHGTRQATRGQVINLASIPLIFLGGWTGYGIRQAAGFAVPIGFLKFSRKFEQEADFLGLQYLYATGYDPSAFVDFFEKMKADEKRKPGTLAKLFSSHPPHGSRIKDTQESINEILPNRPEYVVTTSEFLLVKDRLARLVQRRDGQLDDPNKPTLRRSTNNDTIPTGEPGDEETPGEDERPTLKRRQ